MRKLRIATALFVLASASGLPFTRAAGQTGAPGRYSGAVEQAPLVVEEIPPSAAVESASPATPLDISGGGRRAWDAGDAGEGAPSGAGTESTSPSSLGSSRAEPSANAQTIQEGFRSQPADSSAVSEDVETSRQTSQQGSQQNSQQGSSAKTWLVQMLSPPEGAALAGEPVSLVAAMEGSYGRERQTEVLTAYWRLAVAVARYHTSYETVGPGAASTVMQSAAPLQADLQQAHLAALRAQHDLARVLQWEVGRLPLPSSEPHAGSYNTRYEQIFAERSSRRAWELNQTLPLMYELIKGRADALSTAQADAARFLQAVDEFLEVVLEYNIAIAEYAQLATGDSLAGRDLVPLLIRVDQRDEEHVAGSRERDGKTSRVDGRAAGFPGRAVVDPQVTRTSGERSLLTRSSGTPRRPAHVAQSEEAPSTGEATTLRDQWRKQETPVR